MDIQQKGPPDGGSETDRQRRPRIAVTLGDPNGIGPEVVLKCLTDSRMNKYFEPVVIGSVAVLRSHAQRLGFHELPIRAVSGWKAPLQGEGLTVLDVAGGEAVELQLGHITEVGGRLSVRAIEKATDLCLDGAVDAMVTAPISKEAIAMAGFPHPGHTEYVARRCGCTQYTMMMVSDKLRVGLVTGHMAIREVPEHITGDAILQQVDIIARSLVTDFSITHPRLAVLGLNPHAGDGGVLGREEIDIVLPAIEEARRRGHLVFGPFAADGLFATGGYRHYDAVLAMYHDQGLVPFKTLAFDTGVNFTAGLPIVRTSPDHGTAFDLAGQGKASPGSMRSAIYLAIDIIRRRQRMAHAPAAQE